MLLYYDWRLALLSIIFPPVSYFIAEKMKVLTLFGYVEQSFHQVPGTVKDQITLFDPDISMKP